MLAGQLVEQLAPRVAVDDAIKPQGGALVENTIKQCRVKAVFDKRLGSCVLIRIINDDAWIYAHAEKCGLVRLIGAAGTMCIPRAFRRR